MTPTEIRLKKESKLLIISFDDGSEFQYSCEYLRVHSPSAEVKGHGPGQETLQVGKEHVGITDIEPVGHYAVRLKFDDGHDTGLYTWDYLHELGADMTAKWRSYLDRLAAAGYAREKPE
ncbi:MAG: gamma-butyrobetaine hydroxylase-like domain-containing protein [Woeseiaceae bacterium]